MRNVAVFGEEEPVGHDGGESAPEIVLIHRIEKGGCGGGDMMYNDASKLGFKQGYEEECGSGGGGSSCCVRKAGCWAAAAAEQRSPLLPTACFQTRAEG